MKTLSVVIPVYYNEGSLLPLYEVFMEIETKLHAQNMALQLIFVDDGSQDASFERLMQIKEQRPATKVIKLARNFGAVAASKTGLRFADGDCFTLLAADLQDPPELLLKMVKEWQDGSSFIIAVRKKRDDPFTTRAFATGYYWLLKKLVVSDYPDGGFDVFLLDKKALPYFQQSAKGLNPSLLAYWLGFKPVVLTYDRRERQHGTSRWSFSKRITYLLDSLLSFSVLPLRLISLMGFIVSMLSFLYGISVFVNALFGNVDVRGFATLVSLITFLLGLIIIMLGIIGEYIWRIFIQINQRPEAVIDEVY